MNIKKTLILATVLCVFAAAAIAQTEEKFDFYARGPYRENVGGEEHVVREDTAKAWRGVNWALLSIGAFILIVALVFLSGLFTASNDGGVDRSPVEHQRDGAGRGN